MLAWVDGQCVGTNTSDQLPSALVVVVPRSEPPWPSRSPLIQTSTVSMLAGSLTVPWMVYLPSRVSTSSPSRGAVTTSAGPAAAAGALLGAGAGAAAEGPPLPPVTLTSLYHQPLPVC